MRPASSCSSVTPPVQSSDRSDNYYKSASFLKQERNNPGFEALTLDMPSPSAMQSRPNGALAQIEQPGSKIEPSLDHRRIVDSPRTAAWLPLRSGARAHPSRAP
jgi:hypothetical protein